MKWGRAAMVAEAIFLAALATADLLPGQPARYTTLSALVHGPAPWLVVAAFSFHAVSLGALALHIGARIRAAALACAAASTGMLVVALFWTGEAWVGTVHNIGAAFAFGGLAMAGAASALGTVRTHVKVLGITVAVGTVVMVASFAWDLFPVFERVQVLLNGAWVFAIAWPRAFSIGSGSPPP